MQVLEMLREKQGRRKASAGSRDAKRKARKPFNFNRERKRKDEQIMWAHERKGDRIATDGRTTDERMSKSCGLTKGKEIALRRTEEQPTRGQETAS